MSRIQQTLDNLKKQNRKGLIPFITAGFPEPELTVPLMHALVEGGADIIELGVPFSDPMADGPVIQHASEVALSKGMTLEKLLGLVKTFRQRDDRTPIVLMGYANPIERMGTDVFIEKAVSCGVDGVLVVDFLLLHLQMTKEEDDKQSSSLPSWSSSAPDSADSPRPIAIGDGMCRKCTLLTACTWLCSSFSEFLS